MEQEKELGFMASHVAQAREAHTVLGLAGVRFLVGHAVLVSPPFSLPALCFSRSRTSAMPQSGGPTLLLLLGLQKTPVNVGAEKSPH